MRGDHVCVLSERRLPAHRHQRQRSALRDAAAHAEQVPDDVARQPGQAAALLGLETARVLPRPTSTDLPGQ